MPKLGRALAEVWYAVWTYRQRPWTVYLSVAMTAVCHVAMVVMFHLAVRVFEAPGLAPGTLAEGAKLASEHVPARFWCAACTREFQSDDMFAECPDCHRLSGELRAGREMELASLEID